MDQRTEPSYPPLTETTLRTVSQLHSTLHLISERKRETYPEIEDELFWSTYKIAEPYSMILVTGFYNVYQSLRYIRDNKIPGDIVECGCALGGVDIFIRLLLQRWNMLDRKIILFDTFVGPPVGSSDLVLGKPFEWKAPMENHRAGTERNIIDTCGSLDGFVIVQGFVEDTLPVTTIEEIALLRLDTDFYDSTKAEFDHLYPRLVAGGVFIVDDYGLFNGARRATDQYVAKLSTKPLLNRIDQGVWSGVKPLERSIWRALGKALLN